VCEYAKGMSARGMSTWTSVCARGMSVRVWTSVKAQVIKRNAEENRPWRGLVCLLN